MCCIMYILNNVLMRIVVKVNLEKYNVFKNGTVD